MGVWHQQYTHNHGWSLKPHALPPPSVLIRLPSPDSLLPRPPPPRQSWMGVWHQQYTHNHVWSPKPHALPPPSVLIRLPSPSYPRPSTPRLLSKPPPHPHPLYPAQITPHTLTHWWFSTWRTELPHFPERAPPLTPKPINFHLPTLYTSCTYLASKPDIRTHGIVRLFQHCHGNLPFLTSILINVFIFLDPKPDN